MPQSDFIELAQKRHGRRLDAAERERKRAARAPHKASAVAQSTRGLKAKLLNRKRFAEKAAMRKTLAVQDERDVDHAAPDAAPKGALPAYLLDREGTSSAKVLSNSIKQKRKEKGGKWSVPLPRVRPVTDDEMFNTVVTGEGIGARAHTCMMPVAGGCVCGVMGGPSPPPHSRLPALTTAQARSVARRGSAW